MSTSKKYFPEIMKHMAQVSKEATEGISVAVIGDRIDCPKEVISIMVSRLVKTLC